MRKAIIYLTLHASFLLQGMELPQEQQKKLDLAQQPLVPVPSLNSDLWNIIIGYALQEKSCKEVAQTLLTIGLTSKFFAQRFLYDSAMSGRLVQRCAKKYRAELDGICAQDLEFAAAYQLNTFGIRQWMREKYFVEPKNFKIISYSFFDQLDIPLRPSEYIKEFMHQVLPRNKPPIIQRRLNKMSATCSRYNVPRYTPEIENFLEQLGATSEFSAIAEHRIFADATETCLDPNLDVEDEFNGGFLPLTSVFHSINGSVANKVALLLAAGANPNNRDGYNNSFPLACAIAMRDLASQKLLLEAGANPDTHRKRINVTWTHDTPLFDAIARGPIGAAKQLLASGADPNMHDSAGHYPLEYAITCANRSDMQDRIDYLLPLLQAGANPNQRLKDGYTPISLAGKYGRKDIEEILIRFANRPPHVKNLINKFEELSKK